MEADKIEIFAHVGSGNKHMYSNTLSTTLGTFCTLKLQFLFIKSVMLALTTENTCIHTYTCNQNLETNIDTSHQKYPASSTLLKLKNCNHNEGGGGDLFFSFHDLTSQKHVLSSLQYILLHMDCNDLR